MNKWLTVLVSCLALALAGGCGGDDDEDGGGGGGGAATQQQPPAGGGGAGGGGAGGGGGARTVAVSMENIQFVPPNVTVPVGGTVRWTNGEALQHTVTKRDGPGPQFDSEALDEGQTFQQTFTEPGTINYFCEIHPNQTGTITVR